MFAPQPAHYNPEKCVVGRGSPILLVEVERWPKAIAVGQIPLHRRRIRRIFTTDELLE